MFKKTLIVVLVLLLALGLSACTKQDKAQREANEKAQNAEYFIPKNDLDRKNYNMRQKLADDPTTILWVTCMFPSPNSPMITVPVIGKLTSSNKRPYSQGEVEIADPGGMYGSSAEFRYGFGPNGIFEYYEFYNISTYATTIPTVWQAQKTTLVMENDPTLAAASVEAKKALQSGDSKKAEEILVNAIKQIQKSQGGN